MLNCYELGYFYTSSLSSYSSLSKNRELIIDQRHSSKFGSEEKLSSLEEMSMVEGH